MPLMNLPDAVLCAILSFALGGTADLRNASACSRVSWDITMTVANREDLLWEAEFKSQDAALHKFAKCAGDFRSSWRQRLAALSAIAASPGWATLPRFSRYAHSRHSRRRIPRVVDTVLYNDPRHGFLLNIGEVLGSVVVYGLRRPPGTSTPALGAGEGGGGAVTDLSSAGAALGEFNLPVFAAGAPAPAGPGSTNLLVLFALNGRKMSSFSGYDELIGAIKAAGEFAWWRFLNFEEVDLRRLPRDCYYAHETTPAHSAFAPVPHAPFAGEPGSVDQGEGAAWS